MLYREIIAVFSEIYTKHINTLCGHNVELNTAQLTISVSVIVMRMTYKNQSHYPSKYEAQTALFKDPVRTAQ
jgi:hypothetical protein